MIIQKGIEISWEGGIEYIALDTKDLGSATEITQTTEWWPTGEEFVTYHTSSELRQLDEKVFELKIRYEHDRNTHIPFDDACWGTSTIYLDLNRQTGVARWQDEHDPSMNGECPFKIVSRRPLKQKVTVLGTKTQRNQERFKKALLSIDRGCVIVGEDQSEVLEAAHIIPSCQGGPEFITNGLILRCDLHRLFDADLLKISPEGQLWLDPGVSEYYKTLLGGRKVAKATIDRVKSALAARQEGSTVF